MLATRCRSTGDSAPNDETTAILPGKACRKATARMSAAGASAWRCCSDATCSWLAAIMARREQAEGGESDGQHIAFADRMVERQADHDRRQAHRQGQPH